MGPWPALLPLSVVLQLHRQLRQPRGGHEARGDDSATAPAGMGQVVGRGVGVYNLLGGEAVRSHLVRLGGGRVRARGAVDIYEG
jgi:hypothetical protein